MLSPDLQRPASSAPLVSALILNYRSGRAAVACARHILSFSMASSMEVIVIDNHSDDDSIGTLRASLGNDPRIRIIETSRNDGFGSGYNTGARYAQGEFLLINNADKRLQPGALELLVRTMQDDPSIGIAGPALVHPDSSHRLSIRRDPRPLEILARRSFLRYLAPNALRRYLMLDADWSVAQDVDWVVGGCFLIRRSLFERLQGFDERFFLFFEDADLCRRCRAQGMRVRFVPEARALDRPRRLSGENLRDVLFTPVGRAHLVSALRYFRKWGIV